jgi:hypothetical protein
LRGGHCNWGMNYLRFMEFFFHGKIFLNLNLFVYDR